MSSTASALTAAAVSSIPTPVSAKGPIAWGRFARAGLGTVVAATAANAAFYYLASAVVAYDPEFIVLSNVSGTAIFTVVPAIVAVALYAGLLALTRHAAGIFQAIAALVFVVTLVPDFTYIPTVPGASDAQTTVLVLMHVIAATVIVWLLTRSNWRAAR